MLTKSMYKLFLVILNHVSFSLGVPILFWTVVNVCFLRIKYSLFIFICMHIQIAAKCLRWFSFSSGTLLVGDRMTQGEIKGDGIPLWCYHNRQLKCTLHHPPTQWLLIVVKMYNNTMGMTPFHPHLPPHHFPYHLYGGFTAQCVTFDSPVYRVYIYHHISSNKVLLKTNRKPHKEKKTTFFFFKFWNSNSNTVVKGTELERLL